MSISDIVIALESTGKLTRFVPHTRQPPKRRLYLTAAALKDLNDPNSAVNLLVGRAYILSSLTRWTSGGRVFGDKRRAKFLARLSAPPPEIWEIRVTEPNVQARLFGRFADKDTLVLTKFHTRGVLGNKGPKWIAAMQDCEKSWSDLFGVTPPHSGTTVHDYITENYDVFPI